MNNTNITGLAVGAALVVSSHAYAQQAAKIHRIGFLFPGSPSSVTDSEAFRQGLRELGGRTFARYMLGRADKVTR